MPASADPPYSALKALETTERLLNALRDRVRLAPSSQRQIENDHGWRRGYLSQVLSGNITPTLHHVIAVLDSLKIEPAIFFAEALDQLTPADEIRQKLKRYDEAFAELEAKGFLEGPAKER